MKKYIFLACVALALVSCKKAEGQKDEIAIA